MKCLGSKYEMRKIDLINDEKLIYTSLDISVSDHCGGYSKFIGTTCWLKMLSSAFEDVFG